MRGDPGFFGTLFGAAAKIGRAALGATPAGLAIGAAGSLFTSRGRSRGFQPPARGGSRFGPPSRIPQVPTPGVRGFIERGLPGGRTGFEDPTRRRRRMNVGNAKALRRAIRRTDGFVRLSRSALKNTGYKIVSKSSGKVSRATMDKAVAAAHHAK